MRYFVASSIFRRRAFSEQAERIPFMTILCELQILLHFIFGAAQHANYYLPSVCRSVPLVQHCEGILYLPAPYKIQNAVCF